MHVAGIGVHGRDHPIAGHLSGDAPAPVGAIRALDRFHVLAGDQGQQRHRLGGAGTQILLGQVAQQPVCVGDQGIDQPIPGVGVVPGDRRFARIVVIMGACSASAITSAAPGTSRRTRRIAPINWVTVSWVATASSSTVESSARRVLPASAPVCGHHGLDRFKDPVGPIRGRQPAPPIRQRRGVKRRPR